MTHTPDPQLFERAINILVTGCGGNGSAIAAQCVRSKLFGQPQRCTKTYAVLIGNVRIDFCGLKCCACFQTRPSREEP